MKKKKKHQHKFKKLKTDTPLDKYEMFYSCKCGTFQIRGENCIISHGGKDGF